MLTRFFIVLVAIGALVIAWASIPSVREATSGIVDAGKGAVDAAGQAVGTVTQAVDTGREAVGTAKDTVSAAHELKSACDLVRQAVDPNTPPEQSATLLQQAVGIVSNVVDTYPDVPGVSDLEQGLRASRKALQADPSGQSLGLTRDAVDQACSQLPPIP